jgi:hypothetical protein
VVGEKEREKKLHSLAMERVSEKEKERLEEERRC